MKKQNKVTEQNKIAEQNIAMVGEAMPAYQPDLSALREKSANKPTGDKTLEDYLSLPEDIRVEMIDGVFYDMAAPTLLHQETAGFLYHALRNFISQNGGECVPLIAPTDVQLFCDDKTIVQPDVLVVCDRSKLTPARVVGAPDLVVEVISPNSWYHDFYLKAEKYRQAGVREYWLILPEQKEVIVYDFEKDRYFRRYTFDEKVPVTIWSGKCEVDFKELYESVPSLYHTEDQNVSMVEEALPVYQPDLSALRETIINKRGGEKTLEDYLALPEDVRVEMIDGVFYDMSAPTIKHQGISGRIYQEFSNFVDRNGGRCIPLAAPTDVQLFCDNKTIVQPDVLVVCDRIKLTPARVFGAPDLVVEVVSPNNWRKDVYLKTEKYREAGVKEYWLVFPEQKEVIVYDFARDQDCKKYTFEEKVPVAIWNGKCEVDFKKLYENIRYLYEIENEADKKNEIRIAEDPT